MALVLYSTTPLSEPQYVEFAARLPAIPGTSAILEYKDQGQKAPTTSGMPDAFAVPALAF